MVRWLSPVLLLVLAATQGSADTRYATTPTVELDRCATAWVIRRYVEPEASFEFHPADAMPPGVTPYDLPDAELRRDARHATVEVLIARERLDDPFVQYLGRMVHEAEIRGWARGLDAPSAEVERRVMEAVVAAPDPESALRGCFAVLDALRAEWRPK